MQSSITGNGTTHIYYNVSITNNETTGLLPAPRIDFNETRNQPFINNPSQYFMSVVRFSLDTSTLPIFACQPQLNPTTQGDLIYSISMSQGAFTFQQYIHFLPQTNELLLPAYPLTFTDSVSHYWELYSYQWWNDLVNTAFVACTAGLNALTGGTITAPFNIWDPSGYTAILNTDAAYFDQTPGVLATPVYIYFNTPMWVLYSSYNAQYLGTAAVKGMNYRMVIANQQGQNEWTDTASGITWIQSYQEYPTSPLWNPCQSIVFTTALLPIVPELTAAPVAFEGVPGQFISYGNNANLTTTLTDFEVALDKGYEYKPTINYAPQSEYRLTDMFGTNPCSAINITIFWKDRYGVLTPVTLSPGSSCNVKIMFRRKDFNNLYV